MAFMRQSLNCLKLCTAQNIYTSQRTVRSIKRWVRPTLIELERRRKRLGPQPPIRRSALLEWNYDAELYAFGKRLNEEFSKDLLKRAFIHRSYVIQQELEGNQTDAFEDNSELITEGDALIAHCIKQTYFSYPDEIVKAISGYLMSNAMLAHVARHMGVKDMIFSSDFPVEELTFANTFKAIIAALKQSTTNDRAHLFVRDFLISQLNGKDIYEIWNPQNPYELLTELGKVKGLSEIEPRLCSQSAVNTILANFQVGLYSNKKLLGIGWGESIEIAKDTAALDAIKKLNSS